MATAVYVACALASIGAAWLLFRGWRRGGGSLLFWSTLCFAGLAVNNVILFVDEVVVTGTDLELARGLSGFVALALLLYGLIEEAR